MACPLHKLIMFMSGSRLSNVHDNINDCSLDNGFIVSQSPASQMSYIQSNSLVEDSHYGFYPLQPNKMDIFPTPPSPGRLRSLSTHLVYWTNFQVLNDFYPSRNQTFMVTSFTVNISSSFPGQDYIKTHIFRQYKAS